MTFVIAAILTACGSNEQTNSNADSTNRTANTSNSNSVKDDIEELEMTIKMPVHPEEAVWREESLAKTGDNSRISPPAPTDKKLIAVLRFLKADADKLAAQAEKHRPVLNEKINVESWFPAELIAQSQTSGDETVSGKSYAANDFLQTPYSDGKLTRIEGTDYFVLELFAK